MSRRFKCVLANGCWDLLHYGHLIHLEQARSMGSYLVVSVTDDEHVRKGLGRPVYSEEHRARLVGALKCVDEVLIVSGLIEAMNLVRSDILVKGADYNAGLDPLHTAYCKAHDIEIRFTNTPKYSATEFINAQLDKRFQNTGSR